jgi:hypothetical protein
VNDELQMVDVFDGGRRADIFGSDYFLPSACFGYRMYTTLPTIHFPEFLP